MWEWSGPGGPPGLQHRCRVAWRAVVGSTPIHSRLRGQIEEVLLWIGFDADRGPLRRSTGGQACDWGGMILLGFHLIILV